MLDEYSAAVKLVDYGDYCMMQLENMQPLWPQFRHLSMQAISASLAGNIWIYVGNDVLSYDKVYCYVVLIASIFLSK